MTDRKPTEIMRSPIDQLMRTHSDRVLTDALIQLDKGMASTSGGKRRARQLQYLAARAMAASPTLAVAAAGISMPTLYGWRKEDDAFRLEEQAAISQGADRMEDELVRRAIEGVREEVYYKGKRVGERMKYSDLLLIFALKAARPEKYGDKAAETNINVGITLADLRASLSTDTPGRQVVEAPAYRELED